MSLTPEQWLLVQPLLPPPPSPGRRGRPALDQRPILEGILHKLSTRAPWKRIPRQYAPWQTCYRHYLLWKENGTLRQIIITLLEDVEERGRYYLRRAALQGHVTMEQHGRRLRVYYSTSVPLTWQLTTAMLYYQYTAALMELKRGITAHPDPLVEILSHTPLVELDRLGYNIYS